MYLAGAPPPSTDADPETLSFEFTMLIPGPQVGAIIGKGECNITETRNASKTSIAVRLHLGDRLDRP